MRKKKPIKLITLDTETYDGLKGKLKRIAIYDGEEVHYGYQFSDVEPFLLQYKKEGYAVHVYIHNMEFDLRKIPEISTKAVHFHMRREPKGYALYKVSGTQNSL